MANPLTGDFQAVLQVSGVTLNRLLASMHQNGGATSTLPTLPHSAALRFGDDKTIEGMRGTAWVQIGVPQIELIHGSTDRFWLQADIRARYEPDAGTKPLPEFIQGTVRAMYRLAAIDSTCLGWGKRAADFLWIRVVDDSVSFTGTAVDDVSLSHAAIGTGVEDAEVNARLTRLIARLLRTKFEATPYHVSKRFRQGSMRSLHAGATESAVVLPIGLAGDPVAGRLDSVNQDLLDGRDFGVAISREYILSKVQPVLDEVQANFQEKIAYYYQYSLDLGPVDVDVITIDIDWMVTLTSVKASWSGGWLPILGISAGVITINAKGQAVTGNSAYNITFEVTQPVSVTFDAAQERFVMAVIGSPVVHVHPQAFEKYAKTRIENKVRPQVQAAVDQFVDQLDVSARKLELVDQLKTMDDQADAHFDEAIFGPDGIVVRGLVFLAPRRKPVSVFETTPEEDAYTAFDSWIPGGGIARFEWSWKPFNNAGTSGNQVTDDRFLLRRPPAQGQGKFGAVLGVKTKLPGLDVSGVACLNIVGAYVDAHTGAMVGTSSGRRCHRFGIDVRAIGAVGAGRLFIKEWAPPSGDPSGPVQEVALVEVGRSPGRAKSNTLVVFAGDKWNDEIAETLRGGLRASRRIDAGLAVMMLFRDGAFTDGGAAIREQLGRLADTLEAPILVNEDVHGSWSAALALGTSHRPLSWRLLSPGGGVTWMHEGVLQGMDLAAALDHYLIPGGALEPVSLYSRVQIGMQLSADALHPGYADLASDAERPCPSLPLGRFGGLGAVVTFVQRTSSSSQAQLRELADRVAGAGAGSVLIGVVDGADEDEAERLKNELGVEFIAMPDLDGTLSGRFGINVWPTTVTINRQGRVSDIEFGHGARKLERVERESPGDGRTAL